MYLYIVIEYPGTVRVVNGERILSNFQSRDTLIPEKWQIITDKVPVKYDPIASETRCCFPDVDISINTEELRELVRCQADPKPSWFILDSHVIKLYGNSNLQVIFM